MRLRLVVDGVPVELVFTSHARDRMRERGIPVEAVVEALRSPCEHAYDRSRDVYLLLGCNGVAVVYAARGTVIEIVTVMGESEYRFLVHHVGSRRYRVLTQL
jgi:hypothetical protein